VCVHVGFLTCISPTYTGLTREVYCLDPQSHIFMTCFLFLFYFDGFNVTFIVSLYLFIFSVTDFFGPTRPAPEHLNCIYIYIYGTAKSTTVFLRLQVSL